MSETFYTLLTKAGQAQFANATIFGTKVNFTKFKVGDGNGSYYEPTETQTDLVNTVWTGYINSINVDPDNANWIVIEAVIPTNVGDFTVRELGLYDDNDNLLAVSKCAETYKPIITDGSTKELVMKVVLAVTNTSAVTLKVDPTMIFATKSDLDKKIDKIDYVRAGGYAVTSGTNIAYIATLTPVPTAYYDGMQITILPHIDCVANPTLNVNGLGTLPIVNQDGTTINAGDIKANKPLSLVRVGNSFFIRSAKKLTSLDRLCTKNPWQYQGSEIPILGDTQGCLYNGKVYCLVYNNAIYLYIYDIATNTWSQGASPPTIKSYSNSCVYNGKIYYAGGVTSSVSLTTLEIYDISSNTWTTGASMKYKKSQCAMCAYAGKIYSISGAVVNDYNDDGVEVEVYDIATNTWSEIANIPTILVNAVAQAYNGKIYVMGGNTPGGSSNSFVQIYDIATNVWSTGATDICVSRTQTASALSDGKIYHHGGLTNGVQWNGITVYDIATNTWTQLISCSIPRNFHALCAYNGKLYSLGGTSNDIAHKYKVEICILDWSMNN